MGRSKFTEEQIARALKQAESGVTVAEVCRKMGVSENTLFAWKKKFSGLVIPELRRLRQLEENRKRLRQVVLGKATLSRDGLSESLRL
jgi:putative transposase